jgi:hypothetical protein
MPLARLPQVSNPEPVMRMGARSAAPSAPGTPNGVADVMNRQLVRKPRERDDGHDGGVNTDRAREDEGKPKAADFTE